MGLGSSREDVGSIYDYFALGDLIGSGNFGQVLECFPASESSPCKQALAVKVVDLESAQSKATESVMAARGELDIMEGLEHPNIVRLVQVFEDTRFLYVVMERLLGGELFDVLKSDVVEVTERDVARIGLQLIEALQYIHGLQIVHRDVKAQNILLKEPPSEKGRALSQADIKVIDFGLAARLQKDCCSCTANERQLDTICGTPAMCAPEIWATQPKAMPRWQKLWGVKYGPKVDIYAAGVVLFLTLFGRLPYTAENTAKMADKVCSEHEEPDFQTGPRSGSFKVSEESRDCLAAMLEKDPDERSSADQAAAHAWFSRGRRTRALQADIPLEVRRSAAQEAETALAMQMPDFIVAPTPQEQRERTVALRQARSRQVRCEYDDSSSDDDELTSAACLNG
eukprot:TRINITY_DN53005_c0_g1_i1.p1 TRINITY_DN53005_c0_g1~~TRINITY_DN53005_c0_g1_i1.p1  ORF type:complete len:408 (+),score=96.52 TRINITY_DN53005_c0_g1_i1:32-1225(+)